jgi:hypothetical protein
VRSVPWKGIAIVSTTLVIVLSLLLLPACCCVSRPAPIAGPESRTPPIGSAPIPTPKEAEAKRPTDAVMQNVDFRLDATTILNIHHLRGEMVSIQGPGTPLNFDNKAAFVLRIDTALVGMKAASLDSLMNRYVFGYPGAPLRDLHATMVGHQLRQEGIMHKLIDIPFSMLADVSATPDGRIRLHPTKIDICSLDGLKLMKAFGMSMEKMLDLSKAKGVEVQNNDLILDPKKILPPPAIEGRLTKVQIEGDEMVQVFNSGLNFPDLAPPNPEKNFMYYHGGTLRMGKLLMVDADMEVVDTDPGDPFDFFIDRYNDQLTAGFSRNQLNYGLLVFMRDYSDLGLPCRPGERGFCS